MAARIALDQTPLPGRQPSHAATGGYFLWVEPPATIDALGTHRISTAPNLLFSADRRFTHHLRLNVCPAVDDSRRFGDALRVLGRLAAERLGRSP